MIPVDRMNPEEYTFPFVNQERLGPFIYARRLVRLPISAIQGVRPSRYGTFLFTDRGSFQLVEGYQDVVRAIAEGVQKSARIQAAQADGVPK